MLHCLRMNLGRRGYFPAAGPLGLLMVEQVSKLTLPRVPIRLAVLHVALRVGARRDAEPRGAVPTGAVSQGLTSGATSSQTGE